MRPAQRAQQVFRDHAKTIPVSVEALFKHYGLTLLKKDLDDEISGMLVLNEGQKVVIVNQNQSPQRQRFTAMHELGHYLLHKRQNDYFIDTTTAWRRSNQAGINRRQETEANEFAAALLMPESEVRRVIEEQDYLFFSEDEITQLARLFKVSRPAMKVRLISLGYIADWDVD
jgi:Zn-dependent peptidase ImmA (M78 family)